jgi:archaellum biogenesis protein FlaJ (TadC family)
MSDIFENLKSEWKNQSSAQSEIDTQKIRDRAQTAMQQQQRTLVFTNLIVSFCFAGVWITIGLLWHFLPERTLSFYISTFLMALILMLFLILMWLTVQYKTIDAFKNHKSYIQSNIKKLRLRKWSMTTGIWIYLILLTTVFYFYFVDVLADAELWLKVAAHIVIPTYGLLIMWLVRKKTKTQLEEVKALISDLEALKNEL